MTNSTLPAPSTVLFFTFCTPRASNKRIPPFQKRVVQPVTDIISWRDPRSPLERKHSGSKARNLMKTTRGTERWEHAVRATESAPSLSAIRQRRDTKNEPPRTRPVICESETANEIVITSAEQRKEKNK
ncbi:hypothetical protein GWI33_021752 [Rhynchophorus ferrugineus]|uniref:Uncharacterized protein n=1 Tax=Rhynchophorus ferrugineus TaxID=354439 RepID=A0A834HUG0_RHYFE|nr:hypothetical protein GWI33_021752 [Rhynchophorus ferrugineus]